MNVYDKLFWHSVYEDKLFEMYFTIFLCSLLLVNRVRVSNRILYAYLYNFQSSIKYDCFSCDNYITAIETSI